MAPEQELSADLFRLLVASVKDYSIFLLDPQGYIRSWNEGAQRTKGYSADEIIGKHFSIFYPPQEVRRGKPDYGLRVATDEGRWEEEGWRVRKDGTQFWADVVITALYNEEHNLVGFAKVTRDLSERKRADDERRQLLELERVARQETEAALERLQAIQQMTDISLSYLTLDDLLPALLERISEILLVDACALLLADLDDPDTLVIRATIGAELQGAEGTRVSLAHGLASELGRSRQPKVIEDLTSVTLDDPVLQGRALRSAVAVPLLVKDQVLGMLYAGVATYRHFVESDVQYLRVMADRVALAIEHVRLNETARTARVEAEVSAATLQTQNEFIAIAAHELKTPLTSINAATQLLQRSNQRQEVADPVVVERRLQTIRRQADRMSRLVTHLLESTRLQGGRLILEQDWTNIAELVEEIVDQTQLNRTATNLTLQRSAEAWAFVDRLRIEQVVTTCWIMLLSSVRRMIRSTSKWTAPRTRVSGWWFGIMESAFHRSTEHTSLRRFYQAHAISHQSGLGLGLFISREIVMLHGGTITAEYPEDGGTRFVVTLPRSTEGTPTRSSSNDILIDGRVGEHMEPSQAS